MVRSGFSPVGGCPRQRLWKLPGCTDNPPGRALAGRRDFRWFAGLFRLDLLTRKVVGWSIVSRMTADIVIDALDMAWFRSKPATGVILSLEGSAL